MHSMRQPSPPYSDVKILCNLAVTFELDAFITLTPIMKVGKQKLSFD